MIKNASAWAMLAFLLLFAAVTLWLDRVVQPSGPKLDGSTRHDPDYIIENFSSIKLDPTGQPQLTLAAIKMTHYPDDKTTHLVRPHFMRFAPNSAPMHVYSQRGLVSENGDDAFLHDQVRVVREARGRQTELTLNTSYLHLMPDKEIAVTDKPVVIQDANTFITAVGLKLDQKTHQFKLLSRVKVRYEPRPH